ncbi:hypothetical protein RIF29_01939 [Crotalaria pallida]|uniref:Uncharacterized protein n=1 Tax=Crotalaria pallida TaxID=3830 RepID=A0AAN9IYK5_CROPI
MHTVSYGKRLTRPGFHNWKVHPSLRTVSFGQRLTAAHQVPLKRSRRTVSYGQRQDLERHNPIIPLLIYGGEDENVDVDGLEEKKNAWEEHVDIV